MNIKVHKARKGQGTLEHTVIMAVTVVGMAFAVSHFIKPAIENMISQAGSYLNSAASMLVVK